jgi:hypothetical protein
MEILSHRGYWVESSERNGSAAFERSFNLSYGTETDVRDFAQRLVISHDPPANASLLLTDVLALLGSRALSLALNVKADGLAGSIREALDVAENETAFVFDMAVPDMRSYFSAGVPVFTRMSEFEREPVWLDRSTGVWLDAFEHLWYDREMLVGLLDLGKRVCVVSPELHGREFEPTWDLLAEFSTRPNLMLCTDKPEQASEWFGGKQ